MDDQALSGLRRIAGVNAAFVVVAALVQATDDLDLGPLGETILEAERGTVVAGVLPNGRAAVVLADSKANLGMIRMELRKLRRQA